MDEKIQLSIDDQRRVIHRCPGYTGIIKHRVLSELAAHFTATFYVPQNIDFRYDLEKAINEGRKFWGRREVRMGVKTVKISSGKMEETHHAESCR